MVMVVTPRPNVGPVKTQYWNKIDSKGIFGKAAAATDFVSMYNFTFYALRKVKPGHLGPLTYNNTSAALRILLVASRAAHC